MQEALEHSMSLPQRQLSEFQKAVASAVQDVRHGGGIFDSFNDVDDMTYPNHQLPSFVSLRAASTTAASPGRGDAASGQRSASNSPRGSLEISAESVHPEAPAFLHYDQSGSLRVSL